jgi:hypothetical protein
MMSKRTIDEPIKMYLVEEDRLQQLLMIEHKYMCVSLGFDNDRFEYFWDMMVESGLDQHVSHREFVEAVEHMTFDKLAEMDLELYEEYIEDEK